MSSSEVEGHFASTAAAVAQVPLLRSLDQSTPAQLRKRLHDLSNSLTGLLGHLELANMSIEDGELDHGSIQAALGAARDAVTSMRELKLQYDQQAGIEGGLS